MMGVMVGLDERAGLQIHFLVGLAEQIAALGMADDAEGAADVLDHGDGNLAGKRALGLPVDVLGAHGDIHAVELEDALHRLEIHKRRADGHVHQLEPVALHAVGDLLSEHHGLGDGVVHLPVAGNEVLAGILLPF